MIELTHKRNSVIRALNIIDKGSSVEFVVYEPGKKAEDGGLRRKLSVGDVINDDDIIRQVKTCPQKRFVRAGLPVDPRALEHGHVVRSIHRLPKRQRETIYSLYSFGAAAKQARINLYKALKDQLCIYADAFTRWSSVQSYYQSGVAKLSNFTIKKHSKLVALIDLAIDNYQSLVVNRKKLYGNKDLAKAIGVSDANWSRDWGHYWQVLNNTLTIFDKKSLLAVRG